MNRQIPPQKGYFSSYLNGEAEDKHDTDKPTTGTEITDNVGPDVPREHDLLAWLNTFLHSKYQQIEDLRDSIAFAQIMDAAIPESIPLELLDYNATTYESFYRNASLLRAAMDAVDLSSADIDPDQIAVGQLEANFSLLFFCYTFITTENPSAVSSYDAIERRERAVSSQGLTSMNAFLIRSPSHLSSGHVTDAGANNEPQRLRQSPQVDDMEQEDTRRREQDDSKETTFHSADNNDREKELQYLVASLEAEMTSRIMALNSITENIRSVRVEFQTVML